METTLKFKTNINCNGCKATVTPVLDQMEGVTHWEVDLENDDKILSVKTEEVTSEDVISKLAGVGFEVTSL